MDVETTTSTPLIPLLYWVQKIERAIHEVPSDAEVEALCREHFSPEVYFEVNKEPLNHAGFLNLLLERRSKYIFLDFEFFHPLSVTSDDAGRAGTVGVASKIRTLGKEDNIVYDTDLVLIMQVGWFMEPSHPQGGRRIITKATGVLGEWTPLS